MVTIQRDAAAAAWHRADQERDYWKEHTREFLERFPDQFVAVKDGEVAAVGATLDDVLALLAEKGIEPTDVWLRYFNASPAGTFY